MRTPCADCGQTIRLVWDGDHERRLAVQPGSICVYVQGNDGDYYSIDGHIPHRPYCNAEALPEITVGSWLPVGEA